MSRPAAETIRRDVEQYHDRVLSGQQVAGKLERLAIERHLRDRSDGPQRGLEFDWNAASLAVRWFESLRHPRGSAAGQPFRFVPGQKSEIALLFGWKNRSTKLRRFTKAFLSKARGNGKSPLAAGIETLVGIADSPFTLAAECLCVATKRDQARKYVWNQIRDTIAARPDLAKRARIKRDVIEFRPFAGAYPTTFETAGADGGKADGGGFKVVTIDELHAFANTVAARELLDKIEGGFGKIPQALMVIITTAGNDRSGLWLERYRYSEQVLTGVVPDDTWFAYIFAADDNDDPFDESCWGKANPLLGISVDVSEMRAWARRAKVSPSALNSFKRYKLNQYVTSLERAIKPEIWRRGNQPLPDLTGRPCYGGLDVGLINDLAAWSLVFPPAGDDPHYYVTSQAWLPRECPHDLDSPPWSVFRANRTLMITDSETTDYETIKEQILYDKQRYKLLGVGADHSHARQLCDELLNEHAIEIATIPQTCAAMTEPLRRFIELTAQGLLVHGGDPLLSYSADNVVLKTNAAGQSMPAKNKSSGKIDPFVAAVLALERSLFAPPEVTPNVRVVEWD